MANIHVVCELSNLMRRVVIQVDDNMKAYEFIVAIQSAYGLDKMTKTALSHYPLALLRGHKSLAEYGVVSGTIVYF